MLRLVRQRHNALQEIPAIILLFRAVDKKQDLTLFTVHLNGVRFHSHFQRSNSKMQRNRSSASTVVLQQQSLAELCWDQCDVQLVLEALQPLR